MEFSEFAFRVILLFLPGLICGSVVDELTVHRDRKPFSVLLRALLFGMLAYFSYWSIVWACHRWLHTSTEVIFLKALQDKQVKLSLHEIAFTCLIAAALGIVVSACSTHKVASRLARLVWVSRKSGELDVWGYAFNSAQVEFATVRDHKRDLVYDGWIRAFSDDGKMREILLRDVTVTRNGDGHLLYRVGAIYLSLKPEDNIAIEFRDVPLSDAYQKTLENQSNEHETATEATTSGSVGGNSQERGNQSPADEHTASPSTAADTLVGTQEEIADALPGLDTHPSADEGGGNWGAE